MSTAYKCDGCGQMFEQVHGTLTLGEVCVTTRDGKTMDTWSDADFCLACAKPILPLIAPALLGIEETMRPKPKKRARKP